MNKAFVREPESDGEALPAVQIAGAAGRSRAIE